MAGPANGETSPTVAALVNADFRPEYETLRAERILRKTRMTSWALSPEPECRLESTGWRAQGHESEIVVLGALFTSEGLRLVIPRLIRRLAPSLACLSGLSAAITYQDRDSDTHRAKARMSHVIIRIAQKGGYIESRNVL